MKARASIPRHFIDALIESMDVCDATRSTEATPSQRLRERARLRRDLRTTVVCVISVAAVLSLPFLLAALAAN